jgi:hypothetical protein
VSQPNPNQAIEALRATLVSARQRDPNALQNADHLQSLLTDLAPDMPPALRDACVAVVRTNATSWLTQTPPYTPDQVGAWLVSQYPELSRQAAAQAVAALGSLPANAPAAPSVPSPVFEPTVVTPSFEKTSAPSPMFDQQTVGPPPGQFAAAAPSPAPAFEQHPSIPPGQASWQTPPTSSSPRKSKTPLIIAIVAVLLIGGGVGAFFALKGGSSGSSKLAAPSGVQTALHGTDAVMVSWQPVAHADHYLITDTSGGLQPQTAHGTQYVFPNAAGTDHQFVVQAVTSDGTAGAKSSPATWTKHVALVAPAGFQISTAGFNLRLSWAAVNGATGYQLRDLSNPSFTPDTINDTSIIVDNSSLTSHQYTVAAVSGSETGPPASQKYSPQNDLSAAEAALAYKLPSSMVRTGSCKAYHSDENHAGWNVIAAIYCTPAAGARADGPKIVYVDQTRPGRLRDYERGYFGISRIGGGCNSSYPASGVKGTWNYKKGEPIQGDTFCRINSSNYAEWAWSYTKDNIMMEVAGSATTTSRAGLFNWWQSRNAALRNI